jgi:hypothetical protein
MQAMVVSHWHSIQECLKFAALSANIATEEPIDVALFNSYPDAVSACVVLVQFQGHHVMLAARLLVDL